MVSWFHDMSNDYQCQEKFYHVLYVLNYSFWRKLRSHLKHLGFFASWTEPICPFYLPFWVKVGSLHELLICVHSNSLLGKRLDHFMNCWYVSFQVPFLTKTWITHVTLKGLFTSWTAAMFPFKFPLQVNLLSQIL